MEDKSLMPRWYAVHVVWATKKLLEMNPLPTHWIPHTMSFHCPDCLKGPFLWPLTFKSKRGLTVGGAPNISLTWIHSMEMRVVSYRNTLLETYCEHIVADQTIHLTSQPSSWSPADHRVRYWNTFCFHKSLIPWSLTRSSTTVRTVSAAYTRVKHRLSRSRINCASFSIAYCMF